MIFFEEWQNNFMYFFYCFVGKIMCFVPRLNSSHSTEIISTEIISTRSKHQPKRDGTYPFLYENINMGFIMK